MDPAVLQQAINATTAASQTIAAATTTVVAAVVRGGHQRNGTHRTVNVHGRLMYDEIIINDVWINAILSTLALTCATCLCLCFLYCKFQQWKHAAQLRRDEKNSQKNDNDSLPSYTIVTGLPTYDEAIERMKPLPPPPSPPSPPPPPPMFAVIASASVASKPASSTAAVVQACKDGGKTVAKPDDPKKFGLVSHSLFVHDGGCSHCLSVQELLETYNVR